MNGVNGAVSFASVTRTVYSVVYAAALSSVISAPQYLSRQRRTYQFESTSEKSCRARVGYTSTEGPQWLFVNLLFSIIPMMVALPLFNRFFFNKTGRAWLGPIVTCFIFIIMTGGATTIYFAL